MRNAFSCGRVRVSTACCNGNHFTAVTSSISLRAGSLAAHIRQNCTTFNFLPSTCDMEPRNLSTETSHPVSSITSRRAPAGASSRGLSLPFGSTHDLSFRSRTTAINGSGPSRTTMPPAARTGARSFAGFFMPRLRRTIWSKHAPRIRIINVLSWRSSAVQPVL